MRYAIVKSGSSQSFPEGDAFLQKASAPEVAEILVFCGVAAQPDPLKAAILIELQNESLAEHLGNDIDPERSNILGFARYRNGTDAPSNLIELVRHSNTSASALQAAAKLFGEFGLETVTCSDQVGRIINRLVVAKYNAALRFLDEGLATQSDMDLTCRLGLGYPDGPIERVVRGGLDRLYIVSKAMSEAYGTLAYVPPRRASVAFKQKR